MWHGSSDIEADRGLLIVGGWDGAAMRRPAFPSCEPRIRSCQLALSDHRPTWIVLGTGLDSPTRDALIRAARTVAPDICVAILIGAGERPDPDRWLRRGCRAYLPSSITGGRLLTVLADARANGVAVVGTSLQPGPDVGGPQAVEVGLTRRERDVLQRVSRGLRNSEIAAELTVSHSTVDFHVRNLLQKLGARNRVEAVTRARAIGL